MDKIRKTEEEWKEQLSPELYHIAREKGTERPYSGKYVMASETGVYLCATCSNPLFSADSQFETHLPGLLGWPSFDKSLPDTIRLEPDNGMGMVRTEVVCANCGSHLGHVFDDNSETKTGKHYCINSISLDLKKK